MTGKDEKPAGPRQPPARARAPRDFGAPEPKPSRKVALNEVLRSLQDLVNNELAMDLPPENTPKKIPAEAETAKKPEPAVAPTAEAAAPAFPAEPEISMPPPAPLPPQGLQQELPHLEPETEVIAIPVGDSVPEPEIEEITAVPAPQPLEAVPVDTKLPELEILPPAEAMPAHVAAAPASDHNHTPTDIPVLDDVVDDAEDLEARALPEEPGDLPGLNALPPAVDARKLAIQVAARLNVGLRKDGKPVLSSDVIARLAHALEEALAKAGANRDNEAPK